MGTLINDMRYGVRLLLKHRGLSAAAVLALALGIGANAAIFSVINTVLLKPLPYGEPERLLEIREANPPKHSDVPASAASFLDWQSQNTAFEQLAAYRSASYNLISDGEPERIRAARVSAGTFTLLGVSPAAGRDFLAEEDQPGRANVVAVSHGLWRRRFGADPNLVGRTINLGGNSYTVVAIMPPGFKFPERTTELWMPMAIEPFERTQYGAHGLGVVGRLKPGVSVEQAQSEMSTIATRIAEDHADTNAGWDAKVVPMLDYAVGKIRPALLVLLGAVAFVLLIACANVANLLLARSASRQKEIAIRMAMGAGRWRIARQLLTESVILALAGGACGLMLAAWGMDTLLALAPADLPRVKDVALDGNALLFTLAVTVLTGVIFGLAPALQASKPDLNETLKESGGRGSTGGVRRQRMRNALVVAEVALALVLLAGGGLMIRSFLRLRQVDPGFNPNNALMVRLVLPQKQYADDEQKAAFLNRLLQSVRALPRVQSAGATVSMPFLDNFMLGFTIQGRPAVRDSDLPTTKYYAVSPDYFKAMGIPLLRGRAFTDRDAAGAARVAVINETMARRFFPDEDPIGKRISVTNGPEAFREIVGVVGDVKHDGLDQETPPQTYMSFAQEPNNGMTLVLRSDADPATLGAAIRAAVSGIDKDQPISAIRPLAEVLADSVAQQRFSMLLLGVFAAVALVMAAVGLYGVMSYSVTQRTHEIGVRMALGASPRDVLGLVVGQGVMLTSAGVCIGLAAAVALTRLMESLLFGVTATDPLTFGAISLMLMAVAFVASYIPARRATRVDPMVALRYE
ncbi:MAG: ABC transporter permease [Blastocatellia bacterium]